MKQWRRDRTGAIPKSGHRPDSSPFNESSLYRCCKPKRGLASLPDCGALLLCQARPPCDAELLSSLCPATACVCQAACERGNASLQTVRHSRCSCLVTDNAVVIQCLLRTGWPTYSPGQAKS